VNSSEWNSVMGFIEPSAAHAELSEAMRYSLPQLVSCEEISFSQNDVFCYISLVAF